MNLRDLEQYPRRVQKETRASLQRLALGHFTRFPPDWCPRWAVGLWNAKEVVVKWARVLWRKVVGPNAFFAEAADLPIEKFKERYK